MNGLLLQGYIELFYKAGFDGIIAGTDFASMTAHFFSRSMFRRFYAAPLKELVDHCRARGMPFIKHTDGNIDTMVEELILEPGASGYHAIEPATGMDILSLKRSMGKEVSLWGNVDCGRLLCQGSIEDVRSEVRRLVSSCAPGGEFVLSSSSSIHGGVRPEKFIAMLEEARECGHYPVR